MMRFVVANDRSGKPTWWLYAANNQLVAGGGVPFAQTTTHNAPPLRSRPARRRPATRSMPTSAGLTAGVPGAAQTK